MENRDIRAFLDGHFSVYKWSQRTIERLDRIICAYDGHDIIGCIGGRKMSDGTWYIDLLCVRSDWRGRGLASVLNAQIAEACAGDDRTCRILFKIDKRPLAADIEPVGSWRYYAQRLYDIKDVHLRIELPRDYSIEARSEHWECVGDWKICGVGNSISRMWGLIEVRVFDIEGIYGVGDVNEIIRWLRDAGYDWVSITNMASHVPLIRALNMTAGNEFWLYAYGWAANQPLKATV